jgi:2-polyprenyl-3-methyl-5-hydroxy-6-metoxy-1,4-benzoquinol methylase
MTSMGYVQEKYTKAYFLRQDEHGKPTAYGVIGLEEFEKGGIRFQDKALLDPLDFKSKSVLELGFGRGEAIKYALEHGARQVVGVDFSADAIAIAKGFLEKHGLTAELICADASEFVRSEIKTRFDFVLLLDVLEHVPRAEAAMLLKDLHQILQNKSVVVINTPVFGADNDVINEGLKARARDESDDFPETAGMHCNRYTKGSLKRFMQTCGYSAIGGHFFINRIRGWQPPFLSSHAWDRAFRQGYPVASPHKPKEQFDIAYSARQQQCLRQLYTRNRVLKCLGLKLLPLLWRLGLPV